MKPSNQYPPLYGKTPLLILGGITMKAHIKDEKKNAVIDYKDPEKVSRKTRRAIAKAMRKKKSLLAQRMEELNNDR